MSKPATNAKAISNTDKPRGRKAVALREAQNLPLNQNLSVPHRPLDEKRRATFLARLAETGSVAQSALQESGQLHTARSWRRLQQQDPAFARLMQDAIDAYAARVNEAVNHHALVGDETYLVSAGEIIQDPVTKQPVKVRKISEKILLQLARSTNPAMRDHKVVTNQNGQPVDDPNDKKIILSLSDLQRLDFTDSEMLISICRKIYANRVEEFSGPEMKVISPDIDGEFVDVTTTESADDDFLDGPDLIPPVLGGQR